MNIENLFEKLINMLEIGTTDCGERKVFNRKEVVAFLAIAIGEEMSRLRAERDELRAACEELCDFYERYTGVIATKARAALSRTEGEHE